MPVLSILFPEPSTPTAVADPAVLADLRLDHVLEALSWGRGDYNLKPLFSAPLRDVAAVRYRQAVCRDLEQPALLTAVQAFAAGMRAARDRLAQADQPGAPHQRERWFLDAAGRYCAAVRALADELGRLDLRSPGLGAFAAYLGQYAVSAGFAALESEARAVGAALAEVRYTVLIKENRVTVGRFAGEADLGAAVEETFAKFKQQPARDYRAKPPESTELDHVEARILELVARLYPEVFAALDGFFAKHCGFVDETIRTFDREVQFYVAYLESIKHIKAAGLPFCYPEVATEASSVGARDAFDLALAAKLVHEGGTVVANDFSLGETERILVVTGPNQGGKTTFARMVGQLHYLAGLGLPVPGRAARLALPDRVFTHFERREEVASLRGRLEDELVRIHAILDQATVSSVLILNESFASTTLQDAVRLGTAVLNRIIDRGCLCVYVTFVDELAALGGPVVSLAGSVVPGNPTARTYKIVRKPAEGLAYAWAIAERHGLSYAALRRRLTR